MHAELLDLLVAKLTAQATEDWISAFDQAVRSHGDRSGVIIDDTGRELRVELLNKPARSRSVVTS